MNGLRAIESEYAFRGNFFRRALALVPIGHLYSRTLVSCDKEKKGRKLFLIGI